MMFSLWFKRLRSTAHRTPRHAGRSAQDATGLKCSEVADELARAIFPGALQREIAASLARHGERAQARGAQIVVDRADRMIGDDVLRTRHWKRRNRRAAGERFELNHAERVGQARKHEHVGGGEMRGEIGALFLAEEYRVGIFL